MWSRSANIRPLRVQPVDLAQRPVEVVVVTAVEDPVDREVRAEVAAAEHIGLGPEAQVLQSPGRDPTAAGEQPRAHHAAGVEVVALVPPVVLDLVAAVRFDHREQHRPEANFAAAGRASVTSSMPKRSRPNALIALPRISL